MSDSAQQNLKNHGRFDPSYHFFLFGILVVNLVVAIVHVVHRVNHFGAWWTLVQDRVIRLEERLRLQALAPQEWHAQIYKLSEDQLIGLRFAADDEVVELAKHALEQNLNRKQIKERIKSWRPDDFRV